MPRFMGGLSLASGRRRVLRPLQNLQFWLDPYDTSRISTLPAIGLDGTKHQYLSRVNNTPGSPWCLQGNGTYTKFAFSCWMRVPSAPADSTNFFGIGHAADANNATILMFFTNSGGQCGIQPYIAYNGSGGYRGAGIAPFGHSNGSIYPGLGNWFHFLYGYDGALGGGASYCFINGVKTTFTNAGYAALLQNVTGASNLVMLGNGPGGGSTNACTIEMQDVAFYSHAASQADANNLYAAGRGCTFSQLPAGMGDPFCYLKGDSLNDATANGYNFTFNGTGSRVTNQYVMAVTDKLDLTTVTPYDQNTLCAMRCRAPRYDADCFGSGLPGFRFVNKPTGSGGWNNGAAAQWLYSKLYSLQRFPSGHFAARIRFDYLDDNSQETQTLCFADDETPGAYGYLNLFFLPPVVCPNAPLGWTPGFRIHCASAAQDALNTSQFNGAIANLDDLYGFGHLPAGNSQLVQGTTYGVLLGNLHNGDPNYQMRINGASQSLAPNSISNGSLQDRWWASFTGVGGQPKITNICIHGNARNIGGWNVQNGPESTSFGDIMVFGPALSDVDAHRVAAWLSRA